MLGDEIGHSSGAVTGIRVLKGHVMEVSFRGQGALLEVPITDLGTYLQTVTPNGMIHGDDSHVVMLTEDGEAAKWWGFGIGKPTGPGFTSSWGVAGTFETTSSKLAKLDSMATVVEYEVGENGEYRWKMWEWTGASGAGQ